MRTAFLVVTASALAPQSLRRPTALSLAAPGAVLEPPASPIGLLHPASITHLRCSDVFQDDPAMAAFLKDYDEGPMIAMKHLSNSHVTAQLVSLLEDLNG